MIRNIFKTTLLLSLLALVACSGSPAGDSSASGGGASEVVGERVSLPEGAYTDVSVAELQTMLENKDFLFVNVHIPFEGDIPGTDLSIPYDEIDQHLDQLPAEKDAKVVLYCRSDRMSNIAAERLVELGYSNIWNLDGGMVAWEQAGLEIRR